MQCPCGVTGNQCRAGDPQCNQGTVRRNSRAPETCQSFYYTFTLPYFYLHLLIITNPVKVLAVRSINLEQSVEWKHHSAMCILVYVRALIVAFVRLAAICALLDNCISALWCVSTRVNCDLEKGTTGNNNPLVMVWDGYKGPRGMLASIYTQYKVHNTTWKTEI